MKIKRKEIREAETKIQELNGIVAKTETALMNKEEEIIALEKDIDQLQATLQSLESDKKSLKKQVRLLIDLLFDSIKIFTIQLRDPGYQP